MEEKRITPEGLAHRMLYWVMLSVTILCKLGISTALGMGSKEIVYQLNQPLGMSYATWASYAITALIFYLIPTHIYIKKRPLNLKIELGSQKVGGTKNE